LIHAFFCGGGGGSLAVSGTSSSGRVPSAIIVGSEGTITRRRPGLRGRPCPGAAGSVGFATGWKYQVITVDTVPIFGAEAPGTAAVEVDVEAPNPARTTALVVILIAMDSGVSILFAS
jgi:hypothetical protein